MQSERGQQRFILRSDTAGHFQNPSPQDVEHAFHPQGVMPGYHDIINLLKSNGDYLAAKFFTEEGRCQIAHKHSGMQLDTVELLRIDEAVEIFKRYLRNDLSWTHGYYWKKAFGQLVKEIYGSQNKQKF